MFHARFEHSGDALLVTPLAERLDATSAAEFLAIVGEHVRGRSLVVVSLAHVRAVDASGLAALVALHRRLAPGGAVRLLDASPRVRALLEATSLDELFPAFDDAGAAVRS